MSKVSVELIPRSVEELEAEFAQLKPFIGQVDAVNIPDLLRFDLRSWQGAALGKGHYTQSIPHIRAMDIDLNKPLPMIDEMRKAGIKKVLVIQGDVPQDMMHTIYPTESVDVIWKFRKEMPEVKVYAGIDQYRSNMREEEYRIRRKLQAGATGFFTQPFFDMRFLEMYAEMLEGTEVYWGVSPVASDRSRSYWEMKNQVVFPKDFEPTKAWSIAFASKVLDFAARHDSNVYFMPIRMNIADYVGGALAPFGGKHI